MNALAGVNSPPSKVNIPKEVTVTRTGMLFNIKLFNCNGKKIVIRKRTKKIHSRGEFHLSLISFYEHSINISLYMHTEKVILC